MLDGRKQENQGVMSTARVGRRPCHSPARPPPPGRPGSAQALPTVRSAAPGARGCPLCSPFRADLTAQLSFLDSRKMLGEFSGFHNFLLLSEGTERPWMTAPPAAWATRRGQ